MCQEDGTHQAIGRQEDMEKEGKTACIVVFYFECASPLYYSLFRGTVLVDKTVTGNLVSGFGGPQMATGSCQREGTMVRGPPTGHWGHTVRGAPWRRPELRQGK